MDRNVLNVEQYSSSCTQLRATGVTRHGITQCYLPPHLTTARKAGTRWINLLRRDGRLSWRRWLITYRDVLPAHRRSPIHVLTGPDVQQLSRRVVWCVQAWSTCVVMVILCWSCMVVYSGRPELRWNGFLSEQRQLLREYGYGHDDPVWLSAGLHWRLLWRRSVIHDIYRRFHRSNVHVCAIFS